MTPSADHVANILDATADLCRTVQVDDWSTEEMDAVLHSIDYVAVDIVGLSARVRASRVRMAQSKPPEKVNDTKRPMPSKPPAKPPPPPKPGKGK